MNNVTEIVAMEIQKTFDFYRATTEDNQTVVQKILISGGGVPTKPGAQKLTIQLISQATFVPKGSRLTLAGSHPHRDTPYSNAAVKAYRDIAKKHGLDLAQMALAFVNERPFMTANIIGATTMEQLKMNIASVDVKLSAAVKADIEKVYRQYTRPY